jgi:uncharacterized Fe-S radical SAM superfamily protein PflX
MDQYRPEYKAREFPEISRRLDGNEFREVFYFGKKLNLNIV